MRHSRHTYATEMLRSGVSFPTVMKLLGHSRIDTSARYVRVGPSVVAATVSPLDNVDRNSRKDKGKK